jgi:hypothetical protein
MSSQLRGSAHTSTSTATSGDLDFEALNRASATWLQELGLIAGDGAVEQVLRTDTARLAARLNPKVSPTVLRLLTDWYNWLFIFSDKACESARQSEPLSSFNRSLLGLMQVLASSNCTAATTDPIVRALADLRQRGERVCSLEQINHWRLSVREYVISLLVDAGTLAERDMLHATPSESSLTCRHLLDLTGGHRPESSRSGG